MNSKFHQRYRSHHQPFYVSAVRNVPVGTCCSAGIFEKRARPKGSQKYSHSIAFIRLPAPPEGATCEEQMNRERKNSKHRIRESQREFIKGVPFVCSETHKHIHLSQRIIFTFTNENEAFSFVLFPPMQGSAQDCSSIAASHCSPTPTQVYAPAKRSERNTQ